MTKIKSISITDEMSAWLDANPYIKLSSLCQEVIRHEQELQNQSVSQGENRVLRERLEAVMKKMHEGREFIEKKGLIDEYLKEVEGI